MPVPPMDGDHGTWNWTPNTGPARPDGSKGADSIDITFTPKASANCKDVRLTQTVKIKAYNAAGEHIASSLSEIFDPIPANFRHLPANHIFIKEDGRWVEVFVDHVACEGDPYYNGDDVPHDTTSKGDSTVAPPAGPTPTTMFDGPGGFFKTGAVRPGIVRIVVTFETCAICAADGRILGCMKWTCVMTPTDSGTITVLSTEEGDPSDETKRALKQFASRHTVWASSPDGNPHWFCPEDGRVKHGLPETTYRRIVFNQVIAMTPTAPAKPPEHGFKKIELRKDHAGGGRTTTFDQIYAIAQNDYEKTAIKFTWSGAQIKSVTSILLRGSDDIDAVAIEPFVEPDEGFANDFNNLSAVTVSQNTLSAILSALGEQQSNSEQSRPVIVTAMAQLGQEAAVAAQHEFDEVSLGETLLQVAVSQELQDDELDAINYLRLNMCNASPIKRLPSVNDKPGQTPDDIQQEGDQDSGMSTRELVLGITILILIIALFMSSVS